jgi:endo-1,4-beta-xylanase
MKKKMAGLALLLPLLLLTGCSQNARKTLKDVYSSYFPIGCAIGSDSVLNGTYDDVIHQFSSLTCENEMKWESVEPSEGTYTFDNADAVVKYAKKNNMKVRGHALVWHNAIPSSTFYESDGKTLIAKEALLAKEKSHIENVIDHFGSDVYCYDVVNEVVDDSAAELLADGSNIYRQSPWYEICGRDYILNAFVYAKAELDKKGLSAKLFYNDYSLNVPAKRNKALAMLKWLKDNGAPIDGVGMQSHYHLGSFSMSQFDDSITAFSALGLEVQITEFDIDVYDENNAAFQNAANWYLNGLPSSIEAIQTTIYDRAFQIIRKHRKDITGVTFWGVADDQTWMDKDPYIGRKNYPLVFDLYHQPKTSFDKITNFQEGK